MCNVDPSPLSFTSRFMNFSAAAAALAEIGISLAERRWSPARLAGGDQQALGCVLEAIYSRLGDERRERRVEQFIPPPLRDILLEEGEGGDDEVRKESFAESEVEKVEGEVEIETGGVGGVREVIVAQISEVKGFAPRGPDCAAADERLMREEGWAALSEQVKELHQWLRRAVGIDAPEPLPPRPSSGGGVWLPFASLHPLDDPLCNGLVLWAVLKTLKTKLKRCATTEPIKPPFSNPKSPDEAHANVARAIQCLRSLVRPSNLAQHLPSSLHPHSIPPTLPSSRTQHQAAR